jgi:hypothetical protein
MPIADKPIVLSMHAEHNAAERKIAEEWITQTVRHPVLTENDPTQPGAIRAFAPIAAFGNRMLRVVYCETDTDYRVITLYFDRQATSRRRRDENADG